MNLKIDKEILDDTIYKIIAKLDAIIVCGACEQCTIRAKEVIKLLEDINGKDFCSE